MRSIAIAAALCISGLVAAAQPTPSSARLSQLVDTLVTGQGRGAPRPDIAALMARRSRTGTLGWRRISGIGNSLASSCWEREAVPAQTQPGPDLSPTEAPPRSVERARLACQPDFQRQMSFCKKFRARLPLVHELHVVLPCPLIEPRHLDDEAGEAADGRTQPISVEMTGASGTGSFHVSGTSIFALMPACVSSR